MNNGFTDSPTVSNSAHPARKVLGVIGGMGPAATVRFYELLTKMANAETDQDHIEAIILSRPAIPDRTAYISGRSTKSPVGPIIEAGRTLTALGADYIAIPCITSHCFYDELSAKIETPIINMIKETALRLKRIGARSAGLMATDGAIAGGLFQNELKSLGIRPVIPSWRMQIRVMELIYDEIKADEPIDISGFMTISDELRHNGAENIILACTELSLVKRSFGLSDRYTDALEILAQRSLELCGVRTV